MATTIKEVLEGKEANYLLPFIWQRGETEAIIREEMSRVYDSGIRAVCVEARPHPDFLGPRWWNDMDIIMDEARNRGMRVWMLDDDHFPTGHSAGKIVSAPLELRRVFLKEQHLDTSGPQKDASFLLKSWISKGDLLLAVIAAQRDPASDRLTGNFQDLTTNVQGELLYWTIPEGYWRIFLLLSTPTGGSEGQKDYINPIVAASVKVLLDTVYEAFYARYPEDFGNTFAGFFSDEPGFYNDKETYDYQSKPGKKGVVLPWSFELLDLLTAEFGEDFRKYLPLLWHEAGELTASVRYTYMNLVSKLYAEHFTQQIGDWCRLHDVEYIGHILEENGAHAHLGCGPGHFFRALWGQDLSGLDVVLWQLVPGFGDGPFAAVAGDVDGEFMHYGLAKLGSSLAHIDPKKKGRAMCEVFGAYGWREGLKLMKWMTDHLLVRGVNYFVPHAFSQAEFPDPDAPPHLYARGKNPQYRYYHNLNLYTNRISHLLSGGRHVASAAVLYHASAEWSGDAMPFQKPVRALMQNQVDCDVLPEDILLDSVSISSGKLKVEAETYDCLIIPFCEALPIDLLRRLFEFAEHGLDLLFVDGLPIRSSEGRKVSGLLEELSNHDKVHIVPLIGLAGYVRSAGFYNIEIDSSQPYLTHYHIAYPDFEVYLFFNEHPNRSIETNVAIPGSGRILVYEAFKNQVFELDSLTNLNRIHFSLNLSPYESSIILIGENIQDLVAKRRVSKGKLEQKLAETWSISTATADQYPVFETWRQTNSLTDLSRPDLLPTFSGTFRYETTFKWVHSTSDIWLDLGDVFETAEVWVNEQPIDVRICPPYHYEIGAFLHSGENTLRVEVTNTLVKNQQDFLSRFAQQEPSGLLGPVRLLF